uniref:Uncharacterized protein n=1 Tax=Anguilla anguilla TaxID=7936 RepID=A0A0E9R3G1_ANGAN
MCPSQHKKEKKKIGIKQTHIQTIPSIQQ